MESCWGCSLFFCNTMVATTSWWDHISIWNEVLIDLAFVALLLQVPILQPQARRQHGRLSYFINQMYAHDDYFVQKFDVCGVVSLNYIKKCTSALCMFAYGQVGDAYDEYLIIDKNASFKCLKHFLTQIFQVTNMCKFGKIIENDYKKGFVGHVCFIKFYALSWENFSHFLARFIHT